MNLQLLTISDLWPPKEMAFVVYLKGRSTHSFALEVTVFRKVLVRIEMFEFDLHWPLTTSISIAKLHSLDNHVYRFFRLWHQLTSVDLRPAPISLGIMGNLHIILWCSIKLHFLSYHTHNSMTIKDITLHVAKNKKHLQSVTVLH